MSWQTPKTDWMPGDGVSELDMNRIEGNLGYLKDSPALNAPTVTTQGSGDSSTKVANTAFVTGQDLGVGQTWQNVSASRAINMTYTNTTSKPIQVKAVILLNNNVYAYFTVNGLEMPCHISGASISSGFSLAVDFIVPAGATYSVRGTGLQAWLELR